MDKDNNHEATVPLSLLSRESPQKRARISTIVLDDDNDKVTVQEQVQERTNTSTRNRARHKRRSLPTKHTSKMTHQTITVLSTTTGTPVRKQRKSARKKQVCLLCFSLF